MHLRDYWPCIVISSLKLFDFDSWSYLLKDLKSRRRSGFEIKMQQQCGICTRELSYARISSNRQHSDTK